MKIVLISTLNAPTDQGLRILSSILKKAGYDTSLIFMSTPKNLYSKKELKQLEFFCKDCDLVGISSFSATALKAIQIINLLKRKVPNIVWGGIHATLYPEECINYCNIVCVGEAEEVILDLVKAIEKNKPIDKIKNLWIKKKNEIIKNPIRNMINNLDEIPFQDFDIETHYILKENQIQRFKEKDFGGQIIFMTGRGCPYSCDYCSNNAFNKLYKGKRKSILRWHSIDYVINEMSFVKNKFPSVKFFEPIDDSFSLRPLKEIKEFNEKYKQKINLKFKCLCDPRTITEEKVRLLADAGCYMITIGIQSSERINQEIYHRNMTNEDILRCARILNKYKDKVSVSYDIITCNPYENPDDIIALINLLRIIPKPYRFSVSSLIYFPGTNLTIRALKDKLITEKDLVLTLDYVDRTNHLLIRKKNLYLNLIVTLMRGVGMGNKIGLIYDSWFDYLLDEKRIKKNLKNPSWSILFIKFLIIYDFIKYKILKKIYLNLLPGFRKKYMEVKYKNKIVYTENN